MARFLGNPYQARSAPKLPVSAFKLDPEPIHDYI